MALGGPTLTHGLRLIHISFLPESAKQELCVLDADGSIYDLVKVLTPMHTRCIVPVTTKVRLILLLLINESVFLNLE